MPLWKRQEVQEVLHESGEMKGRLHNPLLEVLMTDGAHVGFASGFPRPHHHFPSAAAAGLELMICSSISASSGSVCPTSCWHAVHQPVTVTATMPAAKNLVRLRWRSPWVWRLVKRHACLTSG